VLASVGETDFGSCSDPPLRGAARKVRAEERPSRSGRDDTAAFVWRRNRGLLD
jgi:hypothetical protein